MKSPILLLVALLAAPPAFADPIIPPAVINYQGRVMQNGANFNGTGQFKFMLLNRLLTSGSDKVVWKNDGTLTATEPATFSSVTVQDGQFTVPLGDTNFSGMTAALPASAFGPPPGTTDSAGLTLRIWFRPIAAGAFTQFTPDVAVNSVPFAFNAVTLGGKSSAAMLTEGDTIAVTSSTQGPMTPNAGLDQSVTAQHGVAGVDFFRGPVRLAPSGASDWSFAALSSTDASLSFFDFTDSPDTLTRRAVIRDNVGGFTKLSGPTDLFVGGGGDRIYVTSSSENAVTLLSYDGTSRVATLRAELADGANGLLDLNGASAVTEWTAGDGSSAETIAVTSSQNNTISIIRTSTPAAPVLQSLITSASFGMTGFTAPGALTTSVDSVGRRLLFAACATTNSVFAFDVTIPSAPSLRWSKSSATSGFAAMIGPNRFGDDDGNVLIVLCPTGNAVALINPDTGSLFSMITNGTNGFNNLLSPNGACQDRGIIAIAATGSSAVTVVDVTDLQSPRLIQEVRDGVGTFTLLGGVRDVQIRGPMGGGTIRLAALAFTDNALTVTDGYPGGFNNQVSLTTSENVGIGTKRPHGRLEAFEAGECLIRAATSSSGDAALQLYEYSPTLEEIPFGYEWRYDGGTDVLQLNATGFPGAAGLKASFTKTGNMTLQGTLTQGSDRARKEHIVPVDPARVLEKIAALPVTEWNYLGEDGVRHIGPMSQDFRAAFGLGATDKGIASVDADGVALAAIKALKSEVDALKKENAEMRELLRKAVQVPAANQ